MELNNEAEPEQEDAEALTPDGGTSKRRMAATLLRCLKLVAGAAPREAAGVTLLHLLQGLGPALSLYLTKVVIDAVTRFNPAVSSVRTAVYACAAALVGYVVVEIVMDTVETLGGFLNTTMHEKVDRQVHHAILAKISGFNDISLFENPRLLNLVHLAQSGTNRLTTLLLNVNNLLLAVFSFVPVFLLGFAIAWWVPFLIFFTSLPSIYVQERLEQNLWSLEEAQAETMRAKEIHEGFLADTQFAKEVRLFSLQPLFLGRWDQLYGGALKQILALRKRGAFAILAWSLLSGVGVAAAYIYVVIGTFTRRHSVGDLAVFTGLIFQVRHVWYILLGNGLGLYTVCLETRPIFDLLELSPTIVSGTVSADASETEAADKQNTREEQSDANGYGERGALIEFKDVSFRYADTAPYVLRALSLRIAAGETVAIVGENGAGKTTLAKLVCRLYDPAEGQILWDGNDLRSLNLDSLRARIAAVPQDFARFSATLRENIAFGWLPVREQDAELEQIVRDVGLQSLLEHNVQGPIEEEKPEPEKDTNTNEALDTDKLSVEEGADAGTGLDRLIGAQLEGGTNLSGGQWQRVAIARAAVRKGQARLMILDEPTASLDPRTEYEALKLLQTLAEECTTIIITHRLSLARACDRIVVLERGQIVEIGTHAELRARGGLYNDMFTRQASSYLDGADDRPDTHAHSAASESRPGAGVSQA